MNQERNPTPSESARERKRSLIARWILIGLSAACAVGVARGSVAGSVAAIMVATWDRRRHLDATPRCYEATVLRRLTARAPPDWQGPRPFSWSLAPQWYPRPNNSLPT